jgi:ribulose-phosphate 3-epimerase
MARTGDGNFPQRMAACLGRATRVAFARRRPGLLLAVVLRAGAADVAWAARGRIRIAIDLSQRAAGNETAAVVVAADWRNGGVALNPATPVGALDEIAADVDQVLVMSVNPGFGGQTFIPRSESKIRAVRALLDRAGNPAPVTVDGGVDHGNAARIAAAGAGILVAGSAIFAGGGAERATRALREAALQGLSC